MLESVACDRRNPLVQSRPKSADLYNGDQHGYDRPSVRERSSLPQVGFPLSFLPENVDPFLIVKSAAPFRLTSRPPSYSAMVKVF